MYNLIKFFINRPVWGNAFIVIILMFGVFSVLTMRKSSFPEVDPYRINVTVLYPGASPTEMEEGVTIKIEQAIKGLENIEKINSTSFENSALVDIQAYIGTDMDELLSDVENSINSINSFPQGAERPIIRKLKTSGMGSTVAIVGISAKDTMASNTELVELANKIERDLLNSKTISQIEKRGFPEKEISINIRENDLLRYHISMQEIASAVGSKNIDITTGIIRGDLEEMSLRSRGRTTTEEEIGEILLRTTKTGEKITISDVADVVLGFSEGSQEAQFNGKPAITFDVQKTLEQDIALITKTIHDYKDKFEKEYPQYEFNIYFEFNKMLNDRIDLLSKNGLMGLVLVLLFLGLFLNLKLSMWVAFGIPFSFLGMFVIGMAYGMTINMISLFGMILVVGILVDDGIVIAENIYTHYEMGKKAHVAALDGTMEVLGSVFSSVITTIVAFSVLMFVEGLEMMHEMAFVVIACLSFSLFEAFIILPGHLGHGKVLADDLANTFTTRKGLIYMAIGVLIILLGIRLFPDIPTLGKILFPLTVIIFGASMFFTGYSKSPLDERVRRSADGTIKYIRDNWFSTAVQLIVGTRRRWYLLSFFFPIVFVVSIILLFATRTITFTFFPNIQPEYFSVEVAYKPGDTKAKTNTFIDKATMIIAEENDRIIKETGDSMMTFYSSNVGYSQLLGQTGNHTGMIRVYFNAEKTKYPIDSLMNRITRRVTTIPEGMLAQEINVGGFSRFGKEIEVGLTSQNDASLMGAKVMLKSELANMEGVFNVKDNMPPGKNEIQLKVKPEAEIYGITQNNVLNQIRQGFFGQEAQRIIIGTDEVKIWVRYPLEDRNSVSDLENMKIKTADGLAIPLKEICDFHKGRAPESLKRLDGNRIIVVDGECTDPDQVATINGVISDSIIPKVLQTYPDIQTVRLGQFERTQKIAKSMRIAGLIGIIIMFIILTLHFNSLSSAFLIMLVIPAGIGGAILGHGLVGIPVSILSVFGMIALIGVLVNDAIVFLDRFNDLLLEGHSIKSAALDAATSRFRPILLTSLTTVAGLLPIIAETSMQAQFLIPMAITIAFGILFGTVFILFFYPSAILFWNGSRAFFYRIKTGERTTDRTTLEPVIKLHTKKHEF